MFALEALQASSGDALIVHFGSSRNPRFMLVDGGFASTYDDVLRARLDAIRRDTVLGAGPLPIDLIVVSHIDADHINGIVRLCRAMRDDAQRGAAPSFSIERLWHNAFRDSLAQLTTILPVPDPVIDAADAEAAGVAAGRELRDLAEFLGRSDNAPFGGFVIGPREVRIGDATVTVVGPSVEHLDELREDWRAYAQPRIERGDIAEAAAYVDREAPNLSSIVVHVRQGDHTMLLTGDGRGDHTLEGLEEAGLLEVGGSIEVDVLKLPHHGSDRNVEEDYFRRIVADNYVISSNGANDNPTVATLRMLVDTQQDREYTVHLTNPIQHAIEFFDADQTNADRNYRVNVRNENDSSVMARVAGNPP